MSVHSRFKVLWLAGGVLLLTVLAAPLAAAAEETYWQGRRGQIWNHGIDRSTGLSNWYTSPTGDIVRNTPRPRAEAIFAEGAQEDNIRVTGYYVGIGSMRVKTSDNGFRFQIEPVVFTITGDGIINEDLTGPPQFTIHGGSVLMMRHGSSFQSVKNAPGIRLKVRQTGVLRFTENADGGNAEVTNFGGTVDFNNTATAGSMKITNRSQASSFVSRLRFYGNSDAGRAEVINGENALVDFATSTGSTGLGIVNAKKIVNHGELTLGTNLLKIAPGRNSLRYGFEQGTSGRLWLDSSAAKNGRIRVLGTAKIAGRLDALGFWQLPPGIYNLIHAQGGLSGKFSDVNAFGGRIEYTPQSVLFVVETP